MGASAQNTHTYFGTVRYYTPFSRQLRSLFTAPSTRISPHGHYARLCFCVGGVSVSALPYPSPFRIRAQTFAALWCMWQLITGVFGARTYFRDCTPSYYTKSRLRPSAPPFLVELFARQRAITSNASHKYFNFWNTNQNVTATPARNGLGTSAVSRMTCLARKTYYCTQRGLEYHEFNTCVREALLTSHQTSEVYGFISAVLRG